jgi:hypothetical protein
MKELLAPDDTRDALRKYGGLLLGLGALMLFIRKGEDWGDFAIFLVLALPAVYFYGEGVFTDKFTGGVRPWQAVYAVLGVIFAVLALNQLIEVVDGSPSSLNTFWIFGAIAGLSFYAGAVKGIRFLLLAGSIATIVSWSALWNELLGDEGIAGNFGVYRGLLGILAILLLAAALYLWRTGPDAQVTNTAVDDGGDQGLWKASELITGAGIAAVLACSLGISSVASFFGPLGFAEFTVVQTAQVWDVLLLVISLGLIGLGTTIGTRGPAYIGGIGLLLFLLIVGLDLNDETPEPDNLGIWPILLLVGGALLIALSSRKEASLGDQPKKTVQSLKG